MNRLGHIQKAQTHLSQVIAHLQTIDAYDGTAAGTRCHELELHLGYLEDSEKAGDPDPYLTGLEAE
jgi:hypothetical protein